MRIVNPFLIYVGSFGLVLGLYCLGWSDVYPALSLDLLLFFLISFALAAFLAVLVDPQLDELRVHDEVALPAVTVWVMTPVLALDAFYTGGIPLVMLLNGTMAYGTDTFIPTVHVIAVTFASAFSVIRFADFLAARRLRYLVEACVPLVYLFLIVYRGPMAMTLAAWGFVYLGRIRIDFKRLALLASGGIVALFLFGVAGDVRHGSSEEIRVLSHPSRAFEQSGVPPQFMWVYLYFTAPMANLQLADHQPSLVVHSASEVVVSEMLPDFISKRIMPLFGGSAFDPHARVATPEVSDGLNVATVFGRAHVLAGWSGAAAMFAELCVLILVYLRLIRSSPYRVPALAILNMLILFSTFENMIAHSPVSFQLAWPLLLGLLPAQRREVHLLETAHQ